MNREERRNLGISKETSDKLEHLKDNCTILEAVQLAQGVSDDAIKNYHKSINPIIASLSIQIEVLKEMLFEGKVIPGTNVFSSIIKEEEFIKLFDEKVEEYNKQREEVFKKLDEENKSSDVKTNVKPFPVQVDITK